MDNGQRSEENAFSFFRWCGCVQNSERCLRPVTEHRKADRVCGSDETNKYGAHLYGFLAKFSSTFKDAMATTVPLLKKSDRGFDVGDTSEANVMYRWSWPVRHKVVIRNSKPSQGRTPVNFTQGVTGCWFSNMSKPE